MAKNDPVTPPLTPGSIWPVFNPRRREWGVFRNGLHRLTKWGWFPSEDAAGAAVTGYFAVPPGQGETAVNLYQAVKAALGV